MHSVLLLALVMYFPDSFVDPFFLLVLTLNSEDVYKGEKEKAEERTGGEGRQDSCQVCGEEQRSVARSQSHTLLTSYTCLVGILFHFILPSIKASHFRITMSYVIFMDMMKWIYP